MGGHGIASEVSLTIDGIPVSAPDGATILEAARLAGIEIPHLCHDPSFGLPPSSACRVCLVEVEGARTLVASCSHAVSAGMRVRTKSERIDRVRRTVVELLLSDHPHDCLTCEKAGACALQRVAYDLGVKGSSFRSPRVRPEPVADGSAIAYDRSKCILCGRCVELCHGVQVCGAIDLLGRGYETRVSLPPGRSRRASGCTECGNCIDVCPTGALSSPRREGAGRMWDLREVVTICPYCGCGCTIVLRLRGEEIVEVAGRPGVGVNRGLLCLKGRFGAEFVEDRERLTRPLIRRDGALVPATWQEALDLVARRLIEIRDRSGPDAIGALASAKCTNEENYLLQKLVRAALGTNNIDHCARLCHASTVAGLAKAFGSAAMTNSIDDLQRSDCIFVIGSNTTECHPIIGSAIARAVARRGIPLIVADPRAIELVRLAAVHLRHRPGTDVALVNAMMHAILRDGLEDRGFIAARTEGFEEFRASLEPYSPASAESLTGVPARDIERAARLYARAGAASIVYSMGITQHASGTDNVLALANLAMLTGNIGRPGSGVDPLRGQNNVQGACDMGALPNVLPGYRRVDDEAGRRGFEAAWGARLPARPGLTVVEMAEAALAGGLRALYVMGENPMLSDPDIGEVERALRRLDLLVVQDIFLTETAQLADVVLPAASFAEKDGTFTNTERRVQRVRKAIEPPGEARADWTILRDLAARLGFPMAYDGPAAILEEIASLVPAYGGISFERLEEGGLQWPCPARDHPGTKILHAERFARGPGRFHPVRYVPPKELPDAQYPFLLSTGRILEHYHTGTMSRRAAVLQERVPAGEVEIHPADARRLGIPDGGRVRIASRRGEIEIAARPSARVPEGTLFLAFHYRESPANRLTLAALDPEAKIPEFKVCAVRVEPCA